ncbi:MAG: protein kinase [Candidatus Riflebacteria bacterium]|nr:protein kinase [Candidatus Riflebacteria bacterium]
MEYFLILLFIFFLAVFWITRTAKKGTISRNSRDLLERKQKRDRLVCQLKLLSEQEKTSLCDYFLSNPDVLIEDSQLFETISECLIEKGVNDQFSLFLYKFEKKFPNSFSKILFKSLFKLDFSKSTSWLKLQDGFKRFPDNPDLLQLHFQAIQLSDIDVIPSFPLILKYHEVSDSKDSLKFISEHYSRNKKFDDSSLDFYKKMGNEFLSDPKWKFNVAMCLYKKEKITEAAELFREVLDLEPAYLPAIAMIEEIRRRSDPNSSSDGRMSLLLDRYTEFAKIAKGGMGILYKVFDGALKKWIAIKVLNSDFEKNEPDIVEKFINESRIMNLLDHRTIPKIIDLSLSPPYFMALELIDGSDLREVLENEGGNGFSDIKKALQIGCELAEGFNYSIEMGVFHCDIKPENILIEKSGGVRIIDFGLATTFREDFITNSPEIGPRGTPWYMAPELLKGEKPSVESEIYAFGVTLFEILTGKRPFSTSDLSIILSTEPDRVRKFRPDCPEDLEILVMDCLNKNPKNRPGSFREIGMELEKFIR